MQTIFFQDRFAGGTAGKRKRAARSGPPFFVGKNQKLWQTRPSRSFGSNQVDLGGMISPASAMAMS